MTTFGSFIIVPYCFGILFIRAHRFLASQRVNDLTRISMMTMCFGGPVETVKSEIIPVSLV